MRTKLAATVIFLAILQCAFARLHEPEISQLAVRVQIFNCAHVPEQTLQTAEQQTDALLGEGGVAITWLDCSQHSCTQPPRKGDFAIRILNHTDLRVEDPTRDHVLGRAIVTKGEESIYAEVYFGRIYQAAEEAGLASESQVLGLALAHELGHLLLGPGHSPTGVMKAKFQKCDFAHLTQNQIHFSPSQRDSMQTELLRRFSTPSL